MSSNRIEKYGISWDENLIAHPAAIELAMYDRADLREQVGKRALSPDDHLRNAIRLLFPEHVFSLNKWSNLLIDNWCHNSIITVWGSSSSGKSGGIGMILLVDLLADPFCTKTSLCTSPQKMHNERAYGSIKRWHACLPKSVRIGKKKKAPTLGLFTMEDEGQTAGIICISTKEGDSNEDLKSKIGAHQKRNRFAVDEPQKCSASILSVKANAGASGDYKEVFFGNPDSHFSPLGKHSIPHCLLDGTVIDKKYVEKHEPSKWRTKTKWRGQNGICIVLDGRESPAIDDPNLSHIYATQDHLDDLIENYGADSMQLWTYGIGRMPPSGAVNTLISEPDLDASGALNPPAEFIGQTTDLASLDPSGGKDGVHLCRIRIGMQESGHIGVAKLNNHRIQLKLTEGNISGQIAVQVAQKLRDWNIPITHFSGDATGNQGAYFDRIEEEMGAKGAGRIVASGKANSNPISRNGDRACDHYADRASQLSHAVATLCHQGRISGLDDRIAHQLVSRQVEVRGGKAKTEEKVNWRLRNQGESPDDLDALACGIDHAFSKGLLKPFTEATSPQLSNKFDAWEDSPQNNWNQRMMNRNRMMSER